MLNEDDSLTNEYSPQTNIFWTPLWDWINSVGIKCKAKEESDDEPTSEKDEDFE